MFWLGLFIGYLVGSIVCLVIESVCDVLDNEDEEEKSW